MDTAFEMGRRHPRQGEAMKRLRADRSTTDPVSFPAWQARRVTELAESWRRDLGPAELQRRKQEFEDRYLVKQRRSIA